MRLNADERMRRLGRGGGDPTRALFEFNRLHGLSTLTAADWPFHEDRSLIVKAADGHQERRSASPAAYLKQVKGRFRVDVVRATQIPGLDDTILVECFMRPADPYGYGSSRKPFDPEAVIGGVHFPVSIDREAGTAVVGERPWLGRAPYRRADKAKKFRECGAKYAAWNWIERNSGATKPFGHTYLNWLGHDTICGAVNAADSQQMSSSYDMSVEALRPLFEQLVDPDRSEVEEWDAEFWDYRDLAQAYLRWRSGHPWQPLLVRRGSHGEGSSMPKAHIDGCRFPWSFIEWVRHNTVGGLFAFWGVPDRGMSKSFLSFALERGAAL